MSTTLRWWNILGTDYPVVRSDMEDGEEGEYDAKHGEIRVATAMPMHRFWECESHELWHAHEDVMNISRRLADELGINAAQAEKVREIYAGTVLPVFLDTLERNGCLTRPMPPKESE